MWTKSLSPSLTHTNKKNTCALEPLPNHQLPLGSITYIEFKSVQHVQLSVCLHICCDGRFCEFSIARDMCIGGPYASSGSKYHRQAISINVQIPRHMSNTTSLGLEKSYCHSRFVEFSLQKCVHSTWQTTQVFPSDSRPSHGALAPVMLNPS